MHARMIGLLDVVEAATPEVAARKVSSILELEGFAGHSGLFCSSPADWFEVGGRFSGDLVRVYFNEEKMKEAERKIREEGLDLMTRDEEEERQHLQRICQIFEEAFPHASDQEIFALARPYSWRSSSDPAKQGTQADAQIMNACLWYSVVSKLKQYPIDCTRDELWQGEGCVYLSDPWEPISEDLIGKVWTVVIDFHY